MEENKGKRIIDKTLLYFIGNLSSKFLSVLLLPLYAYFVKTEELGEYDYFISILNILLPVVLLCIWESVLRFSLKDDLLDKESVISTTVAYMGFASLLIVVGSVVGRIWTNDSIIYIYGITLIAACLKQVWQFMARANGDNKLFVISSICGSVGFLLSNVLFLVILKKGLLGLVLAYAISQSIIFAILESKIKAIKQFNRNKACWKTLKVMLLFSTPLVINQISIWVLNGANRLVLMNTLGAEASGMYSFANRFAIIISMFGTVISMSLVEEAYLQKDKRAYAENFGSIIMKLFKIYTAIILMGIPAIHILFQIVFKSSPYFDSSQYVFILLMASMFAAIANNFGTSFQVTDKTRYVFITTLLGGIATVGFSYLFYRQFGVFGVCSAYCIGTFIQMLSRAIFAKYMTGLKVQWIRISLLMALCIVDGIISIGANIAMLVLILVIAIIISCVLNRAEVGQLYCYARNLVRRK